MGTTFNCCKKCIYPKRHIGCHTSCKEYIDAKLEYKDKIKWLNENNEQIKIDAYDFNKNIKFRKK